VGGPPCPLDGVELEVEAPGEAHRLEAEAHGEAHGAAQHLEVEAHGDDPPVDPLPVHHGHGALRVPVRAEPDDADSALLHLGELDLAGVGEAVLEGVPGAGVREPAHLHRRQVSGVRCYKLGASSVRCQTRCNVRQGCLKYFRKVKVPDRYYARYETSGPTFAKIGALLLDFAILLLVC